MRGCSRITLKFKHKSIHCVSIHQKEGRQIRQTTDSREQAHDWINLTHKCLINIVPQLGDRLETYFDSAIGFPRFWTVIFGCRSITWSIHRHLEQWSFIEIRVRHCSTRALCLTAQRYIWFCMWCMCVLTCTGVFLIVSIYVFNLMIINVFSNMALIYSGSIWSYGNIWK